MLIFFSICVSCITHPSEVYAHIVDEKSEILRIDGADRYETAIKVADNMKKLQGVEKHSTIIVASGLDYADALSGTYLAAKENAPVLTIGKDVKSQKLISEYIISNIDKSGKLYILGGLNAVSKEFEEYMAENEIRIKRLGGNDRYDTNLKILDEADVKSEEIFVCSGTNFADSLAVSAIGKPIVLVGETLTNEQKKYLKMLSNCIFYIVGGEKAINKAIEKQVDLYCHTTRLAGKDRFETSVIISDKFFGEDVKEAVFTYGRNFPDGLSAGPLAYIKNVPLILVTSNDTLYAEKYIQTLKIGRAYVLGGNKLISDEAIYNILNIKVVEVPVDRPLIPLEPSLPQEVPDIEPNVDYTENPIVPEKKPVWIIDKRPWIEIVEKPVYEWVQTWWTYGNGTTKIWYSELEAYNAYLKDIVGEHSSWGTGEYVEIIKGYEKIEIHHPEEGHWEYQ